MPTNCYTLYKTTYNQAIADGLPSGAAANAAQTAMASCLAQQTTKPSTVAAPISVISGGRILDSGPTKPRR